MTKDPRNPPWYELRIDGGQELCAWAAYFQHRFGRQPFGMQVLADRGVSVFLVPCQWPEWFDTDYQPPATLPRWPKPEQFHPVTPEARIRVQRMLDAIPRPKSFKDEREERRASVFKTPTDDDLRRLYPPRNQITAAE